jgi:hypothetical protein
MRETVLKGGALAAGAAAFLFLFTGCYQKEKAETGRGAALDMLGTNPVEGSASGRGSAPGSGRQMAFQDPPLTNLTEIIGHDPQRALTGRSVIVEAPVYRILSNLYFLAGTDRDRAVLVRVEKDHPELRPGQKVRIQGRISDLGDDLSLYSIDIPDKQLVTHHTILVNANLIETIP